MVYTEQFREYLRLSPDDLEDLDGYLQAAHSKARSAGVKDFQDNAMYDQFILQCAGLLYEARSMNTEAIDPAKLQTLMNIYLLPLRYSRAGQ